MTNTLEFLFQKAGKSLFLVGGSVRDTMMGNKPHDFDYTTDALPDEIRAVLNEAGATNIYGLGEKFGTIAATIDGQPIEITTFRSEVYEEGSRHPEVKFGTNLIDDLGRRDFTMNAIAFDLQKMVFVDPFDGKADIATGVIRAVGDPNVRFNEDPLRLIRAVRFAAQLGFIIEHHTGMAMRRNAHLIQTLSKERIAAELSKILMTDEAGTGIDMLSAYGMMEFIMPEYDVLAAMPKDRGHKDNYQHSLMVIDQSPKRLVLRWAAMLHDIGKPATYGRHDGDVHFLGHETEGAKIAARIVRRLKLDGESSMAIIRLVELHMRPNGYDSSWTDGAVRRFVREAGNSLEDLLDLSAADVTTKNQKLRREYARLLTELRTRIADLEAQDSIVEIKSPLDGNDLMALFGLPAGSWIRDVKEVLLNAVLDGTLDASDREAAEKLAMENRP